VSRKKNILLAISAISGGGAELVVANLCRHLDTTKYNISAFYLKCCGERGEDLKLEGYDIVGAENFGGSRIKYLSFLSMRRAVLDKRVDLIHSHSIDALCDAALTRLSVNAVKWIHTFHYGNYPHYNLKYLWTERFLCRAADKLVAVGHKQRETLRETYSLRDDKIDTVWNGVSEYQENSGEHTQDVRIRSEGEGIKLLSISTFIEQKGIPCLLEAAAILKKRDAKFCLYVVGDGPERAMYHAKCRALGLQEQVIFLGWIKDAAARVLPSIDIFVQASLWEAMSMVILEAMAAGKPIVATDVGDNGYMISNGDNGYLVTPGDPIALADAIQRLIDNPDMRAAFGVKSRKRYLDTGTVEKMVKCYEGIYDSML